MLLIDKVIWGILAVFFLFGWINGFLRSLIGPIAFICCLISAVIFYDLNRNILLASVILFGGTIALALVLSALLGITMAAINKEYRGKVFLLSRITGSAINVVWQGNILFLILLLFSALPLQNGLVGTLQKQIPQSTMMTYYKTRVVHKDTRYVALVLSVESLRDTSQVNAIIQSKEFQQFQNDVKFQDFINDPIVLDAVEKKNTTKLLGAKSLRDLVTNDNSMHLLSNVIEKTYSQKLEQISAPVDPQSVP